MLKEFVTSLGLSDRLACVRAVSATGAQIAADPESAYAELAAQANSVPEPPPPVETVDLGEALARCMGGIR